MAKDRSDCARSAQRRPKVDESDPVANLAREVLRGFFDAGDGFRDM